MDKVSLLRLLQQLWTRFVNYVFDSIGRMDALYRPVIDFFIGPGAYDWILLRETAFTRALSLFMTTAHVSFPFLLGGSVMVYLWKKLKIRAGRDEETNYLRYNMAFRKAGPLSCGLSRNIDHDFLEPAFRGDRAKRLLRTSLAIVAALVWCFSLFMLIEQSTDLLQLSRYTAISGAGTPYLLLGGSMRLLFSTVIMALLAVFVPLLLALIAAAIWNFLKAILRLLVKWLSSRTGIPPWRSFRIRKVRRDQRDQ